MVDFKLLSSRRHFGFPVVQHPFPTKMLLDEHERGQQEEHTGAAEQLGTELHGDILLRFEEPKTCLANSNVRLSLSLRLHVAARFESSLF